jgi:hypothetical protein
MDVRMIDGNTEVNTDVNTDVDRCCHEADEGVKHATIECIEGRYPSAWRPCMNLGATADTRPMMTYNALKGSKV